MNILLNHISITHILTLYSSTTAWKKSRNFFYENYPYFTTSILPCGDHYIFHSKLRNNNRFHYRLFFCLLFFWYMNSLELLPIPHPLLTFYLLLLSFYLLLVLQNVYFRSTRHYRWMFFSQRLCSFLLWQASYRDNTRKHYLMI